MKKNKFDKEKTKLGETVKKLLIKRLQLWQKLIGINNFVRGTVVELRRTCTYKGCKLCESGKKHPANYLSTSKDGKTRLVYLPKGQKAEVMKLTKSYKELKEIIEKISDTNVELIKLKSKLESKIKERESNEHKKSKKTS